MKQDIVDKSKEKIQLGQIIKTLRSDKDMSQRQLARHIKIANSNLKYIEDGVNAPGADVYKKIVEIIMPNEEKLKEMDTLYSKVRGTPPPDICEFLKENEELYKFFRVVNGKLNTGQIKKILEGICKEDI